MNQIGKSEIVKSEVVKSEIVKGEILQNSEIAQGIFKMRLSPPSHYTPPKAGQFVNIYLNDTSRLLPRPLSVCDWEENTLTLVYAVVGAGTALLSSYNIGEKIRCSTPLGNGYNIKSACENNKPCVLVGGGVGTPPLLFLTKKLAANGVKDVQVFLGFKSEPFLINEFPFAPQVATDDGSFGFAGNVIDLLSQKISQENSQKKLPSEISTNSQIFSCGPKPMMKALAHFAALHDFKLQVSLEEHMGCGYGACVGCTCKTKNGNRKVCEDGPVFDAREVVWDE